MRVLAMLLSHCCWPAARAIVSSMASVRHNHKALCRSGGKLFPPNLDLAFATVGWLTPISAIKVGRQVTGSREAQDGYSGRAMADGRADRDLAARACRLDRKCMVSYARHRRDLRSIQPVASAEISPIANNPGWFRTFVTVKKTTPSTAMLCSGSNFALPSAPDSCQAILRTNSLLGKNQRNGKTAYPTQTKALGHSRADARPHQVANSIV